VSVLHLHGTADTEVPYDPNAMASVTQWAGHDGCASTQTPGGTLDLDTSIAGAETQTATFDGCPPSITVELWTIQGAGHIPTIDQTTFAQQIFEYLGAHRRQLPD
jgi:poly(3-hydroxybutyrate) depolymerase